MIAIRIQNNLSSVYQASENTAIVSANNKTLSHFILKVDDKDASFIINIDGIAKYKMSIAEMYEDGLTREMDWFPWIQTYDDTDDIYVLVFEPREPIHFNRLSIVLVPAKTTSYSYTIGYVDNVVDYGKELGDVKRLLQNILSELRVSGGR